MYTVEFTTIVFLQKLYVALCLLFLCPILMFSAPFTPLFSSHTHTHTQLPLSYRVSVLLEERLQKLQGSSQRLHPATGKTTLPLWWREESWGEILFGRENCRKLVNQLCNNWIPSHKGFTEQVAVKAKKTFPKTFSCCAVTPCLTSFVLPPPSRCCQIHTMWPQTSSSETTLTVIWTPEECVVYMLDFWWYNA